MTSPEDKKKMEIRTNNGSKVIRWVIIIAVAAAVGFGAKVMLAPKPQAQQQAPAAPSVVLHTVTTTDLAAQREYIGRVESIQSVSLKSQVSGEIMKVHFKEGSLVKAGQLLFSIDSSQYQATVDLRRAELEKAKANLDRAQKYFKRMQAADKRRVSESDIELAESNALQGAAAVSQAKAALKMAQIDLSHTRITAPISGQIGAALFTKGNMVSPSSGALASIVQMDPIRVSFAMPDRDYLNQLSEFKQKGSVLKTDLILTNGQIYKAQGKRDFEDNQVDTKTGTLSMNVRFNNDEGLLIPGAMVRINTKPVKTEIAVVIPQTAILANSQGDFVYVINSSNIAEQRSVVLGTELGTMREVKKGLSAGEKIAVLGIQSIRPGSPVNAVAAPSTEKSAAEIAMESDSDITNSASGDTADTNQKEGN